MADSLSTGVDKIVDDIDEPKWDVCDVLERSALKDVESDKLKILCDHKRRLKRIDALARVFVALIAIIPTIIAMLR